ncbi:hypothetical protein [Tahibacter harae]|uniref:Sulfite exporter TauE/SafE n=1 Tax=Tahibacter harae TaxID=2963937 RepID=A0ABT1QP19_9GAMM|nr:hypothetical protein [Tahibacter harae]MCQ4163740.1 hypothetical protein [Tahibacter harae]
MIEISPPLLAAIALTFFLAGAVKGVSGMGAHQSAVFRRGFLVCLFLPGTGLALR